MGISEDQFRIMQMRVAKKRPVSSISKHDDGPEADLQDRIRKFCSVLGWWVLYSRMDLKTSTPVGSPDLIIFASNSRVIIVEAKSRTGKLGPAQLGVKLKLEALGHTVHVVRSLTEFVSIVEESASS